MGRSTRAHAHPMKKTIGIMAAKFRILKSGISMIGNGCRLGRGKYAAKQVRA